MYQNVLKRSFAVSGWTRCKAELKFKPIYRMTDKSRPLLDYSFQMKRNMFWHLFNKQVFFVVVFWGMLLFIYIF